MAIGQFLRNLFRGPREPTFRQSAVIDLLAQVDSVYRGNGGNGGNERYFPAADTGRLRADWSSSFQGTSDTMRSEYARIAARAKLAYDTDPYARSAVNVLENQVVGTGIRPRAKPVDDRGNDIETLAKILNTNWSRFNDEFLRDRSATVYECQARTVRQWTVSGGVLYHQVPSRSGSLLPIAYQEVDQTQLDFWRDWNPLLGVPDQTDVGAGEMVNDRVINGIKVDKYGEPAGYFLQWLADAVPASDIIHSYNRLHVNQMIGIPALAPVLAILWDLQQLQEDKIIASRVIAAIALWMHRNDRAIVAKAKNDSGNVKWSPGQVITSEQKPEIVQADDSIGLSFKPMVDLYLRSIAVGMGISYQELTTDLSGANYSGARTIVMDKRRGYTQGQKRILSAHSKPIYRDYVKWMFLSGNIPGKSISDFLANPWGYCEAMWAPQPWDWVDPESDMKALVLEKENGWLTDEEVFQQKGTDIETVYPQLAKEKTKKKALGITPTPAPATIPQPPSPNAMTKEKTNAQA